MADLAEILYGYFSFSWEKHEVFEPQLNKFYCHKESRITAVKSERYQLTARIGHLWDNGDRGYDLVEYAGDKKIIQTTDKRCRSPLSFMPDCNFMYYGCYLSICAYMMNLKSARLLLVHGPDDNRVYSFKYRSEIANLFLRNRLRQLNRLEPVKEEPFMEQLSFV